MKEFLITLKQILFVTSTYSCQVCRPFGKISWTSMEFKKKQDH